MNKGLELIEAHYCSACRPNGIDILIHPQSVIHSMVEFVDGSVLAQLGSPDMRIPIAYALAWPERLETPAQRLDLAALAGSTSKRRTRAFPGASPRARSARGGRRRADRPQRGERSGGRELPCGRDPLSGHCQPSRKPWRADFALRNRSTTYWRSTGDARRARAMKASCSLMLPQPPLWLVLIAFVCALGPLVFFHELGHYLVARLFGSRRRLSRSASGARLSAGPTGRARAGRSAGCRSAATSASSAT